MNLKEIEELNEYFTKVIKILKEDRKYNDKYDEDLFDVEVESDRYEDLFDEWKSDEGY